MKTNKISSFQRVIYQFSLTLSTAIVLLLFPKVVSAATYYVSPSGNDASGGTATAPWKTLTKADSAIVSGDTVIIKDGVYPGYLTISKSGTTWKAENKQKAILDGGFGPALLNGNWSNIVTAWNQKCSSMGKWVNLIKFGSNNITVDGLTLRNSCGRGILVENGRNFNTLQNSRIDWTFIAGVFVDANTTGFKLINNILTRITMDDQYAGYTNQGYAVNISMHMSGIDIIARDNIIAWGRG